MIYFIQEAPEDSAFRDILIWEYLNLCFYTDCLLHKGFRFFEDVDRGIVDPNPQAL